MREHLLADDALERFLPCVDPQVRFQEAVIAKTFVAELACVRFLTAMPPNMFNYCALVLETNSAGVTAVRFLSFVPLRVPFQLEFFSEAREADGAGQWLVYWSFAAALPLMLD